MPRIPKFRFPSGATYDYYKDVKKILKSSHENVMNIFETKIAPKAKSWNDSIVNDDELIDITLLLDTLREETFSIYFTDNEIVSTVNSFVSSVNSHTRNQFARQFRAVLGVDPVSSSSKLLSILKAANKENVSYIKSIPEKYHNQVETIVLQGVRRGKSTSEIAKELQKSFKINENRAKFIARDQAGSLTSDLTKARHNSVGLETFIWSDSGDGKVRTEHRSWNGKVFRWGSGAGGDGLLPGEDYGCRCTAEINDEELLEL